MPTPLEFFSYCINFQTVMAGPPFTFRDYQVYIEGREAEEKNLTPKQKAYFVSDVAFTFKMIITMLDPYSMV